MPKLIITEDGSTTLYVEKLDEHYHSTYGAIQESAHIFINSGLKYAMLFHQKINVLEVGFGTGLNALLSLNELIEKNVETEYWALEPHPLNFELIHQMNFAEVLKNASLKNKFEMLHQADWDHGFKWDENFRIKKIRQTIEETVLPADFFNLIYFDAFAPDVQPELWTAHIFRKIYEAMSPKGILVSYSVKGSIKRALKSAGFIIEKLPGPKGKREIIRAMKPLEALK